MAYYRDCTPVGSTVTLRAIFTDGCGKPIDVDANHPNVHIYSPDEVQDDMDAEAAGGYQNKLATVAFGDVTKVATGYYEITYVVPAGKDAGTWYDIWVADIAGVSVTQTFIFSVIEKGSVATQKIVGNSIIVILLNGKIAGLNGEILGEEVQLTFSTTYSPYYASPDLLRMEAGSWLDSIPDDTLSLVIHWSSLEANAWAKGTGMNGPIAGLARTKFVVFDALVRCLLLPVDVGGKMKSLGDLTIENNGSDFEGVISELKDQRDEWLRVVNSGGNIVPGQGFDPTFAVKGTHDPDARRIGRLWWGTSDFDYAQPAGNTKLRRVSPKGTRRFRTGYKRK